MFPRIIYMHCAQEGEGVIYPLKPGTLYGLEAHERHFLRATKGDLHVAW